jgi:hypothetical protein
MSWSASREARLGFQVSSAPTEAQPHKQSIIKERNAFRVRRIAEAGLLNNNDIITPLNVVKSSKPFQVARLHTYRVWTLRVANDESAMLICGVHQDDNPFFGWVCGR